MLNPNGAFEHHILWTGRTKDEYVEVTVTSDYSEMTMDVCTAAIDALYTITWGHAAVMHHEVTHRPTGMII
jgi:hypothetical protein